MLEQYATNSVINNALHNLRSLHQKHGETGTSFRHDSSSLTSAPNTHSTSAKNHDVHLWTQSKATTITTCVPRRTRRGVALLSMHIHKSSYERRRTPCHRTKPGLTLKEHPRGARSKRKIGEVDLMRGQYGIDTRGSTKSATNVALPDNSHNTEWNTYIPTHDTSWQVASSSDYFDALRLPSGRINMGNSPHDAYIRGPRYNPRYPMGSSDYRMGYDRDQAQPEDICRYPPTGRLPLFLHIGFSIVTRTSDTAVTLSA